MKTASDVFRPLVVVVLAAGLLHVASAVTTPATSTTTTAANNAAMKNLKKLEECAGGPQAVEDSHLATFQASDLVDARAYRRAVGRKLAGTVYKAIRCTAPQTGALVRTGIAILWGTAKCLIVSLGVPSVFMTCEITAAMKTSFPLVVAIGKITMCMIKVVSSGTNPPPVDGEDGGGEAVSDLPQVLVVGSTDTDYEWPYSSRA